MAEFNWLRELNPAVRPALQSDSPVANWSLPTRVLVGPGRLDELDQILEHHRINTALIVTDSGLAGSTMVQRVVDLVASCGRQPQLFDQVHPDPTLDDVIAGAAVAQGCDGIISIGGGSALDAAKLIALAAGQSESIWSFIDGATPDLSRIPLDLVPIIAIPTTAGTGSEVGRSGVLTDSDHIKRVIFHPALLATAVICDPELTVGLPRALTVGTGFDALSHALEAYCAPTYHPIADGIAIEAISLALGALPVVVEDPAHLPARQQMMMAALMSATAFQKGLGAMHSISHPLGAWYKTHHGTTNAVLMPYVLEANRPAIEGRIDRLMSSLGLDGGFDRFVSIILELRLELGVPHTLADLGIPAEAIEIVERDAPTDPTAATNPVPVTSSYVAAVFGHALTGERDTV